jgi:hypothetical protein
VNSLHPSHEKECSRTYDFELTVDILPILKNEDSQLREILAADDLMAFTSQANPVSPTVYPSWMKEVYRSKSCSTSALYPRPKGSGFAAHLIKTKNSHLAN